MKSKILIGIIAIVYLAGFLHFGFWKGALYGGDSWGYYIHLPAAFLNHDTGDYSVSSEVWRKYNPRVRDPRNELKESPIGKRVVKYPVGVAIMEAPFFALAHLYCWISGYPTDGFSPPYMFFVGLSTMFFSVWGIWLLMLALRPYFKDEKIRLLIGLTIGLATNLYYSSTYTVGMSHPYLFFLYALLLLGTVRFYDKPSLRGALWVGGSVGAIALTRSPEVISVLIPMLWGINKWADVSGRIRFVKENVGKVAVAVLAFLCMLLPQAFYWKYVSGQWWYNGYQGEHFDWAHPRILDGIFHFQNGWLIYTPVMALSLLGLFWLRKWAADALMPILFFLPLHLYIIYSWWCWNYINGFGSRPMIEISALLAFPLAAFLASMWQHKWSRIFVGGLVAFFIWLNLFQTWQVSQGLLLSESTKRAYYFAIFGKASSDDATAITFNSNEPQPNIVQSGWQKLFCGEKDTLKLIHSLAFNDMEDSTGVLFTREIKKNGSFGFRCDDEFSPGCYIEASDSMDIRPGDYLRLSVFTYVKAGERVYEHDKLALLTIHMFNPEGETIKYSQLSASARTQNTKGSIWFTGVADTWGEASFFVKVPENFKKPDRVKIYVWNPSRQPIYVDDMTLELWRYQ